MEAHKPAGFASAVSALSDGPGLESSWTINVRTIGKSKARLGTDFRKLEDILMNRQKLTQLDHQTNRRRSTLQILLLVLFIPLLAVPGLAQVTNSVSEQSDEQAKDKDQRNQKCFGIAAHVNFTLSNSGTDREAPCTRARNSLFTRTAALEVTDGRVGSPGQPDPDLSKFAVFVSGGAAVPHGDLSTFLDPGFSLNAGLEYMITTQFSAEGTFGYHRFSTFFGGDASLYQLSGNGKFYLVDQSSKLRPFVNGGVGAYVTDSATTHFGGNIGAGVLYEVTPKFGLLGSYNFHAFTAGSGLKFSSVQGGVRFRF